MGGAEYKGLIISLFTLSALISRPFSGKLADTIGRKPVMLVGAFFCIVVSLFYPILTTVAGFLLLRFLHGFSAGFTPTGSSAYLADIIPAEKRGEALGILGLSGSIGMALGPAIGGNLEMYFSIDVLFYCASLSGLFAFALLFSMPETLPEPKKFKLNQFKLKSDEIVERQVWPAATIMLLTVLPFGVILTLIPEKSETLGLANKGLFFTVFTVASMFVRIIAGKLSDKYGRVAVLRISSAMLVGALATVALSSNSTVFLLGGVFYGLANGLNSPTVFAWTIDLANDKNKGKGIATSFIALEAGIGIGAITAGAIDQTMGIGNYYPFMFAATTSGIAFLALFHPKVANRGRAPKRFIRIIE